MFPRRSVPDPSSSWTIEPPSPRVSRVLAAITKSLLDSGWTVEEDLDLVAESAVAIARCDGRSGTDGVSAFTNDFACDELDRFRLEQGVEAILWITSMRDGAGSTVVEGTTLLSEGSIRAVFFSDDAVKSRSGPPRTSRSKGPGRMERTRPSRCRSRRRDVDDFPPDILTPKSTWKELQDAMKKFGSEFDRSESRLRDAYERLNELPEGLHIQSGPLKIRIAA